VGYSSNPEDFSMADRTTRRTVTFRRPFHLSGIEDIPAGSYEVETEEELLTDVSFPAYRRVATYLFLPPRRPDSFSAQMAQIDPLELASAEEMDARESLDDAMPLSAPRLDR
jgi:hypothetical protein